MAAEMSLKAFIESAAEHAAMLTYAIFLVSGLTGGCYVAAYAYVRGRRMTPYLILAYIVIGMVMALTCGIALKLMLGIQLAWEQAFIVGTVVSVTGVLSIIGLNLKARLKIPHTDSSIEIGIRGPKDE